MGIEFYFDEQAQAQRRGDVTKRGRKFNHSLEHADRPVVWNKKLHSRTASQPKPFEGTEYAHKIAVARAMQ